MSNRSKSQKVLDLTDLKITSFVTSLNMETRNQLKGGINTNSMGHTLCEGADCTVRHCAAH